MTESLPYSAAAERNREPILELLREVFGDRHRVLEIGSGSGQHAEHFAAALPQLSWQASERAEILDGLAARLRLAALPNLPSPLALDVGGAWPPAGYDALFTANTLHIMSWDEVRTLFARLPEALTGDAVLAIYGPFREHGCFDTESNAAFDATIRTWAPHMGLRDVEAVQALAAEAGFGALEQHALPANNRCLILRRPQ